MKNENLRSRFPIKRCLVASLVILLVALIVLTLLYGIISAEKISDKSWIFFLVWGIVFGLMLIVYWLRQIFLYVKIRKDEKQGK